MDRTPLLIAGAVILAVVCITTLIQKLLGKRQQSINSQEPQISSRQSDSPDHPDPTKPENWWIDLPRPNMPRKRDVTPEEYELALQRAKDQRRANGIWTFERSKAQGLTVGARRYRWRTSGDSDVCDYCKSKADRTFSWEHDHDHPGAHQCSEIDSCRCYAEPIIKG